MVINSKPKHLTMKASLFTLAFVLAGMFFLAGCRKDISPYAKESSLPILAGPDQHKVHERPLKATMGVYHIYTPDVAKGGCYCEPYLPGYMAGEGEGNSTLLGKFYSYSNWYAYYDAARIQVTYSVPLTDTYYDQLRAWFTEAEMEAIETMEVEVIFFDRQGNSIWSEIDALSMVPSPDNLLHFSISGAAEIRGGTGKFAGACGFYTFSGVSDVFQDSAPGVRYQYSWFRMEGRITY